VNTIRFEDSTPRILLGSDNKQFTSGISNSLLGAGFHVDTADDYAHLESIWRHQRHEVILFEVSHEHSVEPATSAALRIKRQDASQFIGYLADHNLRSSGLTGDAILSRDARLLPTALRRALQR
jgi:hypothetical protein